jgi:ABC-type Na+ efflux pump permease subunit
MGEVDGEPKPALFMTVFPIIGRELRSAARQPFSYHLRVLGVVVLIIACVIFGLDRGFGPRVGGALFASLHCTLFVAIWVLVPLQTADCISRERREGTLGLLFLTELRAGGVVVAKGVAQGVRALTLWIAVLPVLAVPVLLGGVTLMQGAISFLVNLSAICWALAAGLLASSFNKSWVRSLLWAVIIAVSFFLVLSLLAGELLMPIFFKNHPMPLYARSIYGLVTGGGFLTNSLGTWGSYLRIGTNGTVLVAMAKLAVLSIGGLILVILLAGARTRRIWQEEPPSESEVWLRRTFCTPVLWTGFFRRWMRWKLERNPIGWLEQRTWSGRLVTWGWFAVVVSIYSAALTDSHFQSYAAMHRAAAWLLAITMAASAAGSFQRERESGVLELLLVSPLGENAIVAGRLRGLWSQFLPTVALLLFVWVYIAGVAPSGREGQAIAFYAGCFPALPVIGLYFSLRCRNFMSAFLWTLLVGLLLPLVAVPVVGLVFWLWQADNSYFDFGIHLSGWAAFWQVVIAACCWPLMLARLKKRSFLAAGNVPGS